MNINYGRLGPLLLFSVFFTLPYFAEGATPPGVTNLTALSGSAEGSVDLTWTVPTQPFNRYKIRYQPNDPISTETEWSAALSIEAPPLNLVVPSTGTPGTTSTYTVTNLVPGVTYYFAIRTEDTMFVLSSTWNTSPAQATLACTANAFDGEGTASFLPNTIQAGETLQTTMTYTVGSNGINTGGTVALRIPDLWFSPQTTDATGPGYVTSTTDGSASLTLATSGQMVLATVSAGTLISGNSVNIFYKVNTCDTDANVPTKVFSQYETCGELTEIASSPQTAVVAGPPSFIVMDPYEQYVQANTITPIKLKSVDQCFKPSPLSVSNFVNMDAEIFTSGSFSADNDALLDTDPGFGSAAQSIGVTFPSAVSETTFYYRVTTTANQFDHYVNFSYTGMANPGTDFGQGRLVPLSGSFSNISVDTGVLDTTQQTVTFTPDFDGTDDNVFINFSLPSSLPWDIQISSDGFNSLTHQFFGFSDTARVSWDGFVEFEPVIAPPGLYNIRLRLDGGNIVDNTLTVTLQANSISGAVLNNSDSSPLAEANVEVFGPTFHFIQTESDGTFEVFGLQSGGNYTIRVEKFGFAAQETTFQMAGNSLAISTFSLDAGAVLKLSATRPGTGFLPEVFGHVVAHTSDWQLQSFGTIHFEPGKTDSDAGDFYNTTLTTFTALTLVPNRNYTVDLQVDGYGASSFAVNLATGEIRSQAVVLSRRANIEGNVTLPAGSNSNGRWVSVEACQGGDCSNQFASRFYGGVYLSPGEDAGLYRVTGVPVGSYQLKAFTEGFTPAATSTSVASTVDVTGIDFPTFSQGGVISGTITITGDTTSLDDLDGQSDGLFPMFLHAQSQSTFFGGFTEVSVPTDSSATSSTYTITGLEDGPHFIFTHLPGFEKAPPGPATVSVSGGVGTQDFTFNQFSGSLNGTITLPTGSTDTNNVQIELQSFDFGFQLISNPSISGNTYSFTGLGTAFYTLQAVYQTSGLIVQKSIQVVNGQASVADLDLSGDTYSISGQVTTSANSPYNSLSYLVNQTTPTAVIVDLQTQTGENWEANRIVAQKVLDRDFGPQSHHQSSQPFFDKKITYFGTYNATTGTYTITNLSPGTYRLFNNAEMDNDGSNGNEIAQLTQVVTIFNADLTDKDFTLISGYDISGTVRVESGESESGRSIDILLRNQQDETIGQTSIVLSGTNGNYTISKVPPGSYILSARDAQNPIKYTSKEVIVEVVASNVSNKEIKLLKAGQFVGKLRIKETGTLLTSVNFNQHLPDQFSIEARANPWFQGGFHRADNPIINSDGNFSIKTNPGTFDLLLQAFEFIGNDAIAKGKKQFVPITLSGLSIEAGEIKDLGTIDLIEGSKISGTITDVNGDPIPNVLVEAEAAETRDDFGFLQTFTNENGEYTIFGIDPGDSTREGTRFYNVIAAPRPDQHDLFSGFTGSIYAEERLYVDTQNQTTGIDFVLELAAGSISGTVTIPSGGESLKQPFGQQAGLPGAVVLLNKEGNIPQDNPIGDIEEIVDPDGNFHVRGLAAGNYTITAFAQGYRSAKQANIVVTDQDAGPINLALSTGAVLSGKITRSDGTTPNQTEINVLVAGRSNFEDIIVGRLDVDAAGNIVGYEISGFEQDQTYAILAFNDEDDIFVLDDAITVNNDTERDFVLVDSQPDILAQAFKETNNDITIKFEFTRALRNSDIDLDSNSQADDNEPAKLFQLVTGNGTLSFGNSVISSNRKRAVMTYTPASGETSFVIRSSVTFTSVDQVTGLNHTGNETFTFFVGIGNTKSKRFLNASANEIILDNDTSRFVTQPGTFGSSTSLNVEITFRRAQDADSFSGSSAGGIGTSAIKIANELGFDAYPGEMASAMIKAQNTVTPFSSFYDIFLPANVSHFFPEGKEAQLCLSYNSGLTNEQASNLNIYYYNSQTNEYLLEGQNKTIDFDNRRICVNISHASVFTVLSSSDSIISGSNYTGPLSVISFPNPFNLKPKTVTLQNPGSSAASQSINGTMMKFSVPSSLSGTIKVEIYNVVGELVRTLNQTVTGGSHFYLEWDGRNDKGEQVASGSYIGRFTIGGGNEKFFKMAVVK